jgi:hypothetical protein
MGRGKLKCLKKKLLVLLKSEYCEKCKYIEVRYHMCKEIQGMEINYRWFLCCGGFINSIGVVAETSSIYWTQLSKFHWKPETESSLQNVEY